jgi:hypothetical protein
MKPILIIAFICSVNITSFAQNAILWNEKQPLQWLHFSGPVNENSRFDAESFAEVKFNYVFNSPTDFYFDVYANFNKDISWCKKEYQTADLLKHEQLHFDIAGLYAKRLKAAFEGFQYSEDFKNEIQQIFDQKKTEYHLMQQQYDEETNHSLKKERQKDWEVSISVQLNELKYKFNYAKK